MGGREFEILSREIGDVEPAAVEAAFPGVVAKGMMLLPNVVQGSGPFPGREHRWMADTGANASERLAAACLYLALMTEACLDLIGARGPIFVEGPFAHNRGYLSALASLTAREVTALPGSTGTSQGASLLTGIEPTASSGAPVLDLIAGLEDYRRNWYAATERT